jgi:hypothetical protein
MRNTRHTTSSFLLTLAVLAAVPGLADDAPAGEARNELVVFGGISLLDASRSHQTTINAGALPALPGMPGMPGRPGVGGRPPISIPPIQVDSQTSLGSSALFGARYSRLIKDRLALEADLTVAPAHELETRGGICGAGFCMGSGAGRPGGGRVGEGRSDRDFADRSVSAWHYGAGLAYELTGGDVRPLILLGAGGVTWDGAREAGTDFVFRFGAGLKIFFGRVGARVDVVDHLVLDHFASGETEHDVHATAGLLVRF